MPMFIYFPVAYSSWRILTLIIGETSYYNYLNSWFEIYPWDTFLVFNLILIEVIIFLIGFGIFLSGLITMVIAQRKGVNVIQNGLYKFIRHPQNLGIIIFSISFILYIPGLGDLGIRIADFLSWILFSMILVVISDLEEHRMKQKFAQDYDDYIKKTGYFVPKILKHRKKLIKNIKVRYTIRYVLMIVIFIFIVNITNLIAQYLYTNGIVEIYR